MYKKIIDVDNWKRYFEVSRYLLASILDSGRSRASKDATVSRSLDC